MEAVEDVYMKSRSQKLYALWAWVSRQNTDTDKTRTRHVAPHPAHDPVGVVADAVLRDGDEDDVEEEDDGGEERGEEREREGRPDEGASASGAGPGAETVPAED